MDENYIAHDGASGDTESFLTFEQAENWLKICEDGAISQEAVEGRSYIAKITHRSKYTETDNKKNYPAGDWPHDNEFDSVGDVTYEPVES